MAYNVLTRPTVGPKGTSSHRTTLSKDSRENDSKTLPSHPLRIKPAGNAYTSTENIKLAAGLFMGLPDELIIQVLESLDAASLKRLGCTCKALYAFSRLEDLWKTLCIEYDCPPSDRFSGTARSNFPPWAPWLGISILFPVVRSLFLQRKKQTRSGQELLVPRECI